MIKRFRNNALQRLYDHHDARGLPPALVTKTRRVLARLDEATKPADMRLPGFHLHSLTGDLAGHWSVRLSANWRITFRFEGQNVHDVDLVDYH